MDKTQEALHKALKVLNCLNNDRVYETAWVKGAINACEEALEKPAQEHKCSSHPDAPHGFCRNASHSAGRYVCECEGWEVEKPAQEPSTWQSLSDDEIAIVIKTTFPVNVGVTNVDLKFARAIEQALKEKND